MQVALQAESQVYRGSLRASNATLELALQQLLASFESPSSASPPPAPGSVSDPDLDDESVIVSRELSSTQKAMLQMFQVKGERFSLTGYRPSCLLPWLPLPLTTPP